MKYKHEKWNFDSGFDKFVNSIFISIKRYVENFMIYSEKQKKFFFAKNLSFESEDRKQILG